MERLKRSQLTVLIMPPTTTYGPVDGRKYTFTKNKAGTSKFLSIGSNFNEDLYREDCEFIFTAEWVPKLGEYVLLGKLHIDGPEMDEETAMRHLSSLQVEIPSMLSEILRADYKLFKHVLWLWDAPIIIQCESPFTPKVRKVNNFGTPRRYLT